jgi:hypothetical protein
VSDSEKFRETVRNRSEIESYTEIFEKLSVSLLSRIQVAVSEIES